MSECIIHPFPGRHVALEWVAEEDIPSEIDLADRALSALEVLRDFVEPLTVELTITWSDRDGRLPQRIATPLERFWQLRATSLPSGVLTAPTYQPTRITEVPRLDSAALRRWIQPALDQASGEADIVAAWSELLVPATCARLDNGSDAATFVVHGDVGEVHAPVRIADGTAWVCGPVAPARSAPPIAVAFTNEGGRMALTIHVHWSCWTEPRASGRRTLDDAVSRIRRQGWRDVSTDLPPL
jgi:hypothetical protein